MKNVAFIILSASLIANANQEHSARVSKYEQQIQNEPTNGSHHFSCAEYFASLDIPKYYEKTCIHFKKAIELEPHNIQWLFRYGSFACRVGQLQESIDAYKKVLTLHPGLTSVLYNVGFTFKTAGQLELAARIYTHILKNHPDYEPARLGLAFALLSQGKYQEGWKEHLWNVQKQGKDSPEFRMLLAEGTMKGKRILLVPEGGLGDTIQFIRYAQRIKQMGACVIACVQRPLIDLLSRCDYIDEVVPIGTPIPAYDARATLMSLPTFFQDSEDSIPQNIPYIFPDPDRSVYWNKQLKKDHTYKIGIVWQPDMHNDTSRLPIARRGIPLSYFYTLGSTPGVTIYSLQKKEGLDQLSYLPNQVSIKTFDSTFDETYGSFVDTAAVMQSLDLIISTDTATAHLAGAMGKKVWLLLPFNSDWRWLAQRTDSPWYPTMRIFQQTEPFNWDTVIDAVHTVFFEKELYKQTP